MDKCYCGDDTTPGSRYCAYHEEMGQDEIREMRDREIQHREYLESRGED